MKKIILILGGIIIVAAAGRVIWAYQQVKNDEAKMANAPALVVTTMPETVTAPTVFPISPVESTTNNAINSVTKSVGPKETLLAMGNDFSQIVKLIPKDSPNGPQKYSLIYQNSEFKQFLVKYMTAGSIKYIESMPDVEKTMFFMFGLVLVIPDSNAVIAESGSGDTRTLSYAKSAGTFGDSKTSTTITSNCSVKMILESGNWKWERSPFTPDNVICTASGTGATSTIVSSPVSSKSIPTVSSISPASGPAGTNITVHGTGFNLSSTVLVGALTTTPTFVSSDGTKLTFVFPSEALKHPADYYSIEVSNGVGRSDNQKNFTLVLPLK